MGGLLRGPPVLEEGDKSWVNGIGQASGLRKLFASKASFLIAVAHGVKAFYDWSTPTVH